MADYFDSAAANNDQAKADTLKAVATQGSAAKQAFTDAQATNQAAMQSAVKSALATAASRNAPGANVQALQDQNAAPFNERAASLGASQANRLASMDESGQAASRYFDQTKAALPALKANVAGRVAGLQAAAAQRAQAAQEREALIGLQTQKAQAELDNTRAKGAGANTPAAAIKALGGPAATGAAIDAASRSAAAADKSQVMIPGVDYVGPDNPSNAAVSGADIGVPGAMGRGYDRGPLVSMDPAAHNDTVGAQIGLPPGVAGYLVGQGGAGAAKAQGAIDRQSGNYGQALSDFTGSIKAGADPTQAMAALYRKYGPVVGAAVVKDYSTMTAPNPTPTGGDFKYGKPQ